MELGSDPRSFQRLGADSVSGRRIGRRMQHRKNLYRMAGFDGRGAKVQAAEKRRRVLRRINRVGS